MKKTGIFLAAMLIASGLRAQERIELYFGPKLFTRTDVYTQPLEFSDGTQVFYQPNRNIESISTHFGGNVGVQIPFFRYFSFKVGTSYQNFGHMHLFEFPIEGPFETIQKGKSMAWHMFSYETALRFQKSGFGAELGLKVLHRAVEADKSLWRWRYLSEEQNDLINDYSDNVKPITLMLSAGFFYRYRDFELILNVDFGNDFFHPVTYQNETLTPISQLTQVSFGLNYYVPLRKKVKKGSTLSSSVI